MWIVKLDYAVDRPDMHVVAVCAVKSSLAKLAGRVHTKGNDKRRTALEGKKKEIRDENGGMKKASFGSLRWQAIVHGERISPTGRFWMLHQSTTLD